MGIFTVLCSVLLLGAAVPAWSETHSLYYIYTALSKPVDLPGIYEFTAMGLLDDRQIDYYNSEEQKKIPKQHWMKEKMQADYWEKGTQSRKSKEQWFNVNVDILMKRMRHNESDVHVLQWRHGCEVEKQGDELKFSKGIDEYSYDGENFLSFDDKDSQWVAPVDAALPTKRKWDNVPILNQYTKGYLEKECVDWLSKFREYGDKELRSGSPPEVKVFAKRCKSDKTKVKLTCFATGFYPKDVTLLIRKYRASLPEDEIESSGIRPNHDETFQLKKSAIIREDEAAEYDCFVSHRTLEKPVIVTWDGKCKDCTKETILGAVIGAVVGGVVVLAAVVLVFYFLKKKNIIAFSRNDQAPRVDDEENVGLREQENVSASPPAFNSRNIQEPSSDEEKASLQPKPENARNRSDSNANPSQEKSDKTPSETGSKDSVDSDKTPSKTGSKGSVDSGRDSAGTTTDNSSNNSQEAVNNV
ncbi:H-2 class I histocompatibility antigen, Q10 alpha chain-like [Garra rufa]|uniref:H-2 class I histocompatibility antigen, Q10 alpha chain-like n=1 Tax=Garra rufa TaxID=137080 RepID=UPI003CCED43B